MKRIFLFGWVIVLACFGFSLFLAGAPGAGDPENEPWGSLEAGPCTPGFRLVMKADPSRLDPLRSGESRDARPVRIYLWYPSSESGRDPLRLCDYVRWAAEDFHPSAGEGVSAGIPGILPVPLKKGMPEDRLVALLEKRTWAVPGSEPSKGRFPLLVVGQGLYYESPFSQAVLCEFLASHGYVVATCPLVGTHYRLVNLNVEDLETAVRDLEFVLAHARTLSCADPGRVGVIGYDLGGMAGLLLSMRNPEVDAFLSLDAGILFGHASGLPNAHPSYRENRLVIPWMHMTQARFIKALRDEQGLSSLMDRKPYEDSYLVHVQTESHGTFSSYAMLGIRSAVPGYWGPVQRDPGPVHEAICARALAFLDGYLKGDQASRETLRKAGPGNGPGAPILKIERKQGRKAPPRQADLVQCIIEKGFREAGPLIERARADYPEEDLFEESVLNWLGYHFLYWWGREVEAVEVFELNTALFPESANAHDSLGEAYLSQGRTEAAVKSYEKSLELDPGNANAAAVLERLGRMKKGDQ